MKTNKIDLTKFKHSVIFTVDDLMPQATVSRETLLKSLNRMVIAGQIAKASRGKFYKPEKSIFGELKPDISELIKDLLYKNGKPVGYISGYGALNSLGLTTQVPNAIKIYTQKPKRAVTTAKYRISFCLQRNIITSDNIRLLTILDSLTLINSIPDTEPYNVYSRFKSILLELSADDINSMFILSLKYPPRTRALLGAFLEEIDAVQYLCRLKQSLKISYKFKTSLSKMLKFAQNWNLI